MRKLIAALLAAASLASPALAQRDPGAGGFQPRGERMVRSEGRTPRPTAQVDRPQPRREAVQAQRQVRQEARQVRQTARQDRQQAGPNQQRVYGGPFERARPGDVRQSVPARIEQGRDRGNWNSNNDRRNDGRWNNNDRRNDGRWNNNDRRDDGRWNNNDRRNDGRWNNGGRGNDGRWTNNGRRDNDRWGNGGRGNNGRWSRDWRRDPRYNWQDYRQRNRGAFNIGRYYAPQGWGYGYQRFSLGVFLNQSLFGQDYWLDDPFNYRLPPADGPYRWVRYYGDVLLVDVRNGYVVDVIHDFFG